MGEWISVEDRLPSSHEELLFYSSVDNTVNMGAFYRASHKFISDGNKYHKSDVTHWMPLPEPPKKGE